MSLFYNIEKLLDKICLNIAHILPRRLVMWSTIRLFAHGTTGKWDDQIVDELTLIDALGRWSTK